jgi:Arc/MetJ-type ribon-helix-helix transcriptional regulator
VSHAGRDALQSLLAQIQQQQQQQHQQSSPAAGRRKGGRGKTTTTVDGSGDDGTGSVVSHAGRDALQALLSQAAAAAVANSDDADDGQNDDRTTVSVISHMGRDAIQYLLDQVQQQVNVNDSTNSNNKKNGKPRGARRSVAPIQRGHDFLAAADTETPAAVAAAAKADVLSLSPVNDMEDDDLSDDDYGDFDTHKAEEEVDDFSEAVSSLGRKALKELLDTAAQSLTRKPKGRVRDQL